MPPPKGYKLDEPSKLPAGYTLDSAADDTPPPPPPAAKEPGFFDKLTAGYDPGAAAFDEKHPVLGKPVRFFSSVGGAIFGAPAAAYHAFADPATDEEKQRYAEFEKQHGDAPGSQTSGVRRIGLGLQRLTTDPVISAGQDYASGKVTPEGAIGVLPEAVGTSVGSVATGEAVHEIPSAVLKTVNAKLRSIPQSVVGTDTKLTRQVVSRAVKQQERLNEGAERANATAAKKHAGAVQEATEKTAQANKELADKHQDAIRDTHAANEQAKGEHALATEEEAARVAEENKAAEHAVALRKQAETELETSSNQLNQKVEAAEKTAKAQNDASWNAVRSKTGDTPGDVTHVRAVTEAAVEMADPNTSSLFKSILREGEASRPVTVNGTAIGPEHKMYGQLYQELYGEPPPLGKNVTFDKLHRWYNYLGEKLYSGGFKDAGTYNALKSVRGAIDQAMGDIAQKTGATEELANARRSHTQYTETFRDSPNEPATVASKVVSEVSPEATKARQQSDRLAKVSRYDPSIATDAARIKGLRDHISSLQSEDQLRKGLSKPKEIPPPKIQERPAKPEFKKTPEIKAPEKRTPRQIEVDLKRAREDAIAERARTWGHFNARDIGILASSVLAEPILKMLSGGAGGEGASSLLPIAAVTYEGGKFIASKALEKPAVIEWLSRPPKGEAELLGRIQGADKIKIMNGMTEAAIQQKMAGKSVRIAPAAAVLLGAANVDRIAKANGKTPAQMKKDIEDIRNKYAAPSSSNPALPTGLEK